MTMSHQISKLKQFWHNIKVNDLQAMIAVMVTLIGLSLWVNRTYFFWPPMFAPELNDEGLDAIFICVGVALFVCTGLGDKDKDIVRWLLAACGAIAAFCFTAGICHGIFGGEPHMAQTAIGDALLFALIVHVANLS